MTIEIFWGSGSPYSWRALLALEIKRLPYESRLLQFSKQEHKAPAYLALNPRGKVPTLRDGDYVLYESLAILAYLDRKYPEPPLFGRTAEETGTIWRLISEFGAYLEHAVTAVTRPIFFGRAAEQADRIRAEAAVVHGELGRYEASLGDSPWLAGAAISAADLALFPAVQTLLRAGDKEAAAQFALPFLPFAANYPHLAAWVKRVEALPGYDRTYPPHWR